MKTNVLGRLIVLGACGGMLMTAQAEKVQIEQLPQNLQDRIRAHTGANRIEDIDRQTRDGQTTYEVAFKQNGKHTELKFNQQGQLVDQSGAAALTSGKIEYNQLPAAVQQMVATRVQQGEINDIDRQVKDGQVTYEVGFKANGEQKELLLSQDGRIIRDVSIGATPGAATGRAARMMLSPEPVQLSQGKKVEMEQVPQEVRTVVQARAKGARIEDMEMGTWNGRPVYQAAFKDQGKHVELQVASNGQIVHDPRMAGQPVAAPVATPTGRAATAATAPTGRAAALGRPGGPFSGTAQSGLPANALVPMTSPQEIDDDALPQAVKQAANLHAPNADFDDIRFGTWQNRVVYQFEFKDDGRDHFLQLDQTGQLVHDTRHPNRQ